MKKCAQSIQQPKALRSKRPYTSFLQDFVDQPSWSAAPKRYRPESVDKFVTQWVESVSESEAYRERHCRSDTIFNCSDGDLISRKLTQFVPNNVDNNRDAQEIIKPFKPAAISRSSAQSVRTSDADTSTKDTGKSGKSSKNKVENPSYREVNLAFNNVYMRERWEQFPAHITSLLDYVGRGRDSPGPTPESIWRNEKLVNLTKGATEAKVETHFQSQLFSCFTDPTTQSVRTPMAKHAVPNTHRTFKISNPCPDLLFGYDRGKAFPQLEAPLESMVYELPSNVELLTYPFFVVELKGDSPSGAGSLWAATNQCLGGSASCVNLAEMFNDKFRECKNNENQLINSAVFSVAMNATEARLFITWKHEDHKTYYLQDVKSFLLSDVDHYLLFRRYVRNIVDWGTDQRLKEIRDSMDKFSKESRKRAASPSADDSANDSSRKRRA